MKAGGFITLEGIEGVGKTSAIACVGDWLRERGGAVRETREPGGSALGEKLRDVLLQNDGPPVAPLAELLLMFAARAQHLHELIRPAIAGGTWVVCDRFTDATYAYQGGGRGLPLSTIAAAEALVHGDLQPDLTILLDAPPALGLARARRRSVADRFEQEKLTFFERVRTAYLARAASAPGRFLVVDATVDMAAVHGAIRAGLAERLA